VSIFTTNKLSNLMRVSVLLVKRKLSGQSKCTEKINFRWQGSKKDNNKALRKVKIAFFNADSKE